MAYQSPLHPSEDCPAAQPRALAGRIGVPVRRPDIAARRRHRRRSSAADGAV